MKQYNCLKIIIENKIAVIAINNPPVNALSKNVILNLEEALKDLNDSKETRALIITGTGDFFSAGADIREIDRIKSEEDATEMVSHFHRTGLWIESLPKPVIAAINGICFGGGLELAMTCHIRIASKIARFSLPEINLGIIPGFGGTQRLPRLVGKGKAMEMLLTGESILAHEAKEIGLVNLITEQHDLLSRAKELAGRIASKSLVSVSKMIEAISAGLEKPIDNALKLETRLFSEICKSADKEEGVKAFLGKRHPKFQDK